MRDFSPRCQTAVALRPDRLIFVTTTVLVCFLPDLLRHITRHVTVLLLIRCTLMTSGLRAPQACLAFAIAAVRAVATLSGRGTFFGAAGRGAVALAGAVSGAGAVAVAVAGAVAGAGTAALATR